MSEIRIAKEGATAKVSNQIGRIANIMIVLIKEGFGEAADESDKVDEAFCPGPLSSPI